MNVVAWLGLGLGAANVVVWVAVVVAARRLWSKLSPQVAPLLAMFMPATPDTRSDEELIAAYGSYGSDEQGG